MPRLPARPRVPSVAAVLLLLCAGAAGGLPGAEADGPLVLDSLAAPLFLGPHAQTVTAVRFSPDGAKIATGSEDGVLRTWDAASGRLLAVYAEDATRGISDVAWSPDGTGVAVVGTLLGKDAVLWDTATGSARDLGAADPAASRGASMLYRGLPVDLRAYTAVAFSPDGRLVAQGGRGVIIRDAATGAIVASLREPTEGVTGIAFFPDGQRLAACSMDGMVRVVTVPGGHTTIATGRRDRRLRSIAVSPDGNVVIAGDIDSGMLFIVDSGTLETRAIETGLGPVSAIAFTSPRRALATIGANVLSVDVTDSASPAAAVVRRGKEELRTISVAPGGREWATAGTSRTVEVVDAGTGAVRVRLPGLTDIISAVATSADGTLFAVATMDARFSNRAAYPEEPFSAIAGRVAIPQDGEVRLYSPADGRAAGHLPLPGIQVTAVAFVPGTGLLAVAGGDAESGAVLFTWDPAAGLERRAFRGHAAEVLTVAVSPDGRVLASGDGSGRIIMWDLASGARTLSVDVGDRVDSVAFSADGKLLAVADGSRTIRILEVSTGRTLRAMNGHALVKSLAFSPRGDLLAVGTRTAGGEVWDLGAAGGPRRRVLRASGDSFPTVPGFVAFAPDGALVACAGVGKDIALFEAATGRLVGQLRGHAHAPTAAAFLPDGRLVSGGEERTVRLWDPGAGSLLATWLAVPADPAQGWDDEWVGFRPDGAFLGSPRLDRLAGWLGGIGMSPPVSEGHRPVASLLGDR